MKISTVKNISFSKKLVANCHIGTCEDKHEAKIYQLDKESDYFLFRKVKDVGDWQKFFLFFNLNV